MVYGMARHGYYRRRSIFGGLWMIALGTLFLLANFHVVEWWTISDWFRQYWPVLLIFIGVVHLLRAIAAQRQV